MMLPPHNAKKHNYIVYKSVINRTFTRPTGEDKYPDHRTTVTTQKAIGWATLKKAIHEAEQCLLTDAARCSTSGDGPRSSRDSHGIPSHVDIPDNEAPDGLARKDHHCHYRLLVKVQCGFPQLNGSAK